MTTDIETKRIRLQRLIGLDETRGVRGDLMTIDTAVEALRAFAFEHGEIEFAHMCTVALAGETDTVRPVSQSRNQNRTTSGNHYTFATRSASLSASCSSGVA